MDHSFSIDTCIYNSGTFNKSDTSGHNKSKREDESVLSRKIEEELGLGSSNDDSGSTDKASKSTFLKKFLDNFSKLNISEKVTFLKNYLNFKTEFEYSDNSIDTYTLNQLKTTDNDSSEVSTTAFNSKEYPSVDLPISKLSTLSARSGSVRTPNQALTSPRTQNYTNLEKKSLERVVLLFVETTNKLALKAVENNQHVLTDKLICNMFKMLKEVYENDYKNDYANSLDSKGVHPLFNVNFNIPGKTPDSVRTKVESMAKDQSLKNAIAEKVYMFQFIDKFKLFDLHRLCLSHTHSLVSELWNLCVDSVVNKRQHDWENVYRCRNSVIELKDRESSLKNQSELDPKANADAFSHYSESIASSKMTSDHNLPDLDRYGTHTDILSPRESPGSGRSKNMWLKDVYMPNSRVLNYIAATNKLLSQERVEYLKGHFNFRETRDPGTWVKEPNNQLPTYCLLEKKAVSIKVRGKLPCDIVTALTIISDSELATEWVPFSKDSKDLKIFTKTSRIFKQVYDYPMVGYKETLFHGLSTNLLDEANCVIISCSNPPASKKEADYVLNAFKQAGLESSDYLTVDSKHNFAISGYTVSKVLKKNQKSGDILFILFPYSDQETLMESYGNVIQDVKIVPMKFVVFIAKKMILGMFRKVSSICRNFKETKFARSVQERSDFCRWMEEMYKEYKENNPQSFAHNQAASTYTYALNSGRKRLR